MSKLIFRKDLEKTTIRSIFVYIQQPFQNGYLQISIAINGSVEGYIEPEIQTEADLPPRIGHIVKIDANGVLLNSVQGPNSGLLSVGEKIEYWKLDTRMGEDSFKSLIKQMDFIGLRLFSEDSKRLVIRRSR